MKEVQDRVVQFSNRYKLTNAETGEVLGTFDFDEVTGTVQQVGTEIDKELFDSIAADLAANASSILAVDEKTDAHIANTDNPHEVTKTQVGLGNVDNTSDVNKPVSTAQATAIADAKKAGTDAQETAEEHIAKIDNPHSVTKEQVGLGNVNNTSDVNKPVSTAQAEAIADAKQAGIFAQSVANAHIDRTDNPHEVTKAQVGLGNVDNTSDVNKPVSTATSNAIENEKNERTLSDQNLQEQIDKTIKYTDQTQILNEEQKTQARENINAQVAGNYAEKSDLPDTSNFLTTDTAQDITAPKTFKSLPSFMGLSGEGITFLYRNDSVTLQIENNYQGTGNNTIILPRKDGTLATLDDISTTVKSILLAAFPVGTTVMSPTNPASVVGGSWQKESAGKFFRTAASQTSNTTDGGSDDAIVVSHTHSLYRGLSYGTKGSFNGAIQYLGSDNFYDAANSVDVQTTGQSGTDANLPTYKGRIFWTRIA